MAFSFRDEELLEFGLNGGLASECSPPSSHGSVVDAIMRGTPEPPSCIPPEHVDRREAYNKDVLFRRRWGLVCRDRDAMVTLKAAYGPPTELAGLCAHLNGSLRGLSRQVLEEIFLGWGKPVTRPTILLVSDVVLTEWVRSGTDKSLIEWVVGIKKREDEVARRVVTRCLVDKERRRLEAIRVWEGACQGESSQRRHRPG